MTDIVREERYFQKAQAAYLRRRCSLLATTKINGEDYIFYPFGPTLTKVRMSKLNRNLTEDTMKLGLSEDRYMRNKFPNCDFQVEFTVRQVLVAGTNH